MFLLVTSFLGLSEARSTTHHLGACVSPPSQGQGIIISRQHRKPGTGTGTRGCGTQDTMGRTTACRNLDEGGPKWRKYEPKSN
uniref:Putative secreted protein n=1 Tax=Anopheles darlingi TaxID=43151 RepID=A0A2M4DHV4_ANODA